MTEEKRMGADAMEMWSRWYETGARMWSEALGGSREGSMSPFGLYPEAMEEYRERMMGVISGSDEEGAGAKGFLEPQAFWSKWFETAADSWQKSARLGTELAGMTPRWLGMLGEARENLMNLEKVPGDPVEFAVQWYNATSGPYAEFVGDIIEREDVLEASSRAAQNYASLYKIFSRQSEEYLSTLQFPVRSDVTRVAELVVNLDDKVDRLEESFEDLEDSLQQAGGRAEVDAPAQETAEAPATDHLATAESVAELSGRIDRVEGKLDQLLAAMEGLSTNGRQQPAAQEEAQEEAPEPAEPEPAEPEPAEPQEIKATTAARRKAEELGVDLSEVEGTGTGGQITVGDVRERGEG